MAWVPHVRCVARFNLGPGTTEVENASCTLNFEDGAAVVSLETTRQNIANQLFDKWAAYVTDSSSRIHTGVRLMHTRLYVINEQGRAEYPPAISEGAPVKGASGGAQHPFQVSNVVTLVASPGGKGRFGRIYLPPQAFNMENDTGKTLTTDLNVMATAAFSFLHSMSDLPGIDAGWELRIAGSTGSGTLREVEEVRYGRCPDTQRRRRRNLDEAYVIADFDA